MNKSFVVQGDLWLYCQEGGFADDAFVLKSFDPETFLAQLTNAATNLHLGTVSLDDLVAKHFNIEYDMPSGNRHVGMVKITIEKLDEN